MPCDSCHGTLVKNNIADVCDVGDLNQHENLLSYIGILNKKRFDIFLEFLRFFLLLIPFFLHRILLLFCLCSLVYV